MEIFKIIMEVILVIVISFMIGCGTSIIHELGHAIPALVLTKDRVKITLGRLGEDNKEFKIIRIGRLSIVISSLNPFIGWTSWNESQLTENKKIIISAGGPVASLVILLTLLLINKNVGNELLLGIFRLKALITITKNFALAGFILTVIPIKNNNYTSDGYKILKLIKLNKYK
ncbi:Zn-dependent proteases [Clostridium putrefaciens]|uniref:Zn-dependent proteases n=1 Tax=Clostridium putrefaciens TaxID=99675 RepID=A0A381J7S6_9CLOT|nr:hypothetical protein [Clostridium putrefaciens]SUY46506.1 Zn-dependent proteases [Clostridium putrefaciens]